MMAMVKTIWLFFILQEQKSRAPCIFILRVFFLFDKHFVRMHVCVNMNGWTCVFSCTFLFSHNLKLDALSVFLQEQRNSCILQIVNLLVSYLTNILSGRVTVHCSKWLNVGVRILLLLPFCFMILYLCVYFFAYYFLFCNFCFRSLHKSTQGGCSPSDVFMATPYKQRPWYKLKSSIAMSPRSPEDTVAWRISCKKQERCYIPQQCLNI